MEGGRKARWEVDRDGSRRGKREKGESMGEGAPVFILLGGGCGEEEKKEYNRRGEDGRCPRRTRAPSRNSSKDADATDGGFVSRRRARSDRVRQYQVFQP